MATSPQFASVPKVGFAAVSTANANRDGTGTLVSALTAGASGYRCEEIVLQATNDPADSIVTVFLKNGSTYMLFTELDIGNPAAASTTTAGYRLSTLFDNLVIPAGWEIVFGITVAPTAGVVNCIVLGGDL